MTRAARLLIAGVALFLLGAANASAAPSAASFAVSIQNFAFAPATQTINVGDSVAWTNRDPALHSARANDGSFDTLVLNQGQSKTITFNVAGTFGYICGVHGASMSGTIVVRAVATPPPTAPPTPQPTPPPTPQPTAPPTPQPTVPPTPIPTIAPTSSPTAAATSAAPTAAATPSVTVTASAVAAAQTDPARASSGPAAATDSGPAPLLIAGAAVIIVGLIGVAFALSRR